MGISHDMQHTTKEHLIIQITPDLDAMFLEDARLRSWEIDMSFRCLVIGWCLDIEEQREILRKEEFTSRINLILRPIASW